MAKDYTGFSLERLTQFRDSIQGQLDEVVPNFDDEEYGWLWQKAFEKEVNEWTDNLTVLNNLIENYGNL